MKKAIIGALLVLGVVGSLPFAAASVSAETEPEQCLQTDHPEIERLRDTYYWLEEAHERANVILVDSFDEPGVAGSATHLLAKVRILKKHCNDTFLDIYLHEMAHIFHRNNSVYIDPIIRSGLSREILPAARSGVLRRHDGVRLPIRGRRFRTTTGVRSSIPRSGCTSSRKDGTGTSPVQRTVKICR